MKTKYFPHIAGSLVLASAASLGMLHKWEPDKSSPDAHLIVYADKIAKGTPTVCSGITNAVSTKKLVVGEKWTEADCQEQEEQALEKLQLNLARCFKVKPPQSVFDAATSHAWNFGYPKTCSSAAMLQWNRSDWKLGCQLLAFQYDGKTPNWSYSDGVFYKGLHLRRQDEMALCLRSLRFDK